MDKDLAGDMKALLAALGKEDDVSCGNGTGTAGSTYPSDSLEGKLDQLLGALRANGSDVWEGKPLQDDLGIRFDFKQKGSSGEQSHKTSAGSEESAKASLDSLMEEYVEAVGKVRMTEGSPDE